MSVKLSDTTYVAMLSREKVLLESNADLNAKLAQAERERDAAMKVVRAFSQGLTAVADTYLADMLIDFPHLFTEKKGGDNA